MTRILVFILIAGATASAQCTSSANVPTGQYDFYRTGANLNETVLTPAALAAGQFGHVFSLSTGGAQVFAQPIVIHNVKVNGTTYCTVVYVATMDNRIYAFDGENAPTASGPYLWRTAQFGTPVSYVVGPASGFASGGILGTPVADAANGLLYFVSVAQEGSGGAGWKYRVHAIRLSDGVEVLGSGALIGGSVPGTGDDSNGTSVPFIAAHVWQRPALLDLNGTIYAAFGFGTATLSREYTSSYHGWVFGYKSCVNNSPTCATDPPCFSGQGCSLQQVYKFNTTPNSHAGGIWMSARGPASDGGTGVFVSSGNGCKLGSDPLACPPQEFEETVGNLAANDFFKVSATTTTALDYNDLDLDSGGVLMIPPRVPGALSSALVAAGKTGTAMLLSTHGLAGQTGAPLQQFQATGTTATCPNQLPVFNQPPDDSACLEYHHPAYWSRGASGLLYIWGFNDILRAYSYNTTVPNRFNATPVATYTPPQNPGNGGALSISANRTASAILWSITGNDDFSGGMLSAFRLWDSVNGVPDLTKLWDSSAGQTNFFSVQRFVQPVVSNGKVFVPVSSLDSHGNHIIEVFGLCSSQPTGCLAR